MQRVISEFISIQRAGVQSARGLNLLGPIWFICIVVATIATINQKTLVVLAQDYASDKSDFNYTVIVDCGSSGSRAHIFRWPRRVEGDFFFLDKVEPMRDVNTGKPLIKRVTPGLASLRERPELASLYMRPLIEFVSAKIPRESQRETPIYFMATAGLRLISPEERKQILDDIARDVKQEYNFQQIHTHIISGSQEGTYEWFSLNAHANRLNQSLNPLDDASTFHCKSPLTRRLGLLEMGGASTQVAFELIPELDRLLIAQIGSNPVALETYRRSQVEVKLGYEDGRKVRLFSTTFLGLGSNSAHELAVDLLVRDWLQGVVSGRSPSRAVAQKLELDDPCLPLGSTKTVTKPLEILRDRSRTIGFQSPESDEPSIQVLLRGRGDWHRCSGLLKKLLKLAKLQRLNCNNPSETSSEPCSMEMLGLPFVPFRYNNFVGLGDMYHTTNEMINASGKFSMDLIIARATKICSTPFGTLLNRYPEANRVDSERVLMECFKINWILTFLRYGLGLSPKISQQLETVNKVNGNQVDWTFGAIIVKFFNDINSVII